MSSSPRRCSHNPWHERVRVRSLIKVDARLFPPLSFGIMLGFSVLLNFLLDQPFLTIHCTQALRLGVDNFSEFIFEVVPGNSSLSPGLEKSFLILKAINMFCSYL